MGLIAVVYILLRGEHKLIISNSNVQLCHRTGNRILLMVVSKFVRYEAVSLWWQQIIYT